MPKISVVIPLYNKEKEIEATLQSVFSQTFTDFEVLVINDGSTDNSEAKVLGFNDSRLQYIVTKNHGVSYARNLGIKKAMAPLVAFLDADDLWLPQHLQDLMDLKRDYPQAGIFAKNYCFVYKNNHKVSPYFNQLDKKFRGIVPDFFVSNMPYRLVTSSTIAVSKKVFEKVGTFNVALKKNPAGEDTEMWIRIALKFPIAFDSSVSAYYCMETSNRLSLVATERRDFPKLNTFKEEEESNSSLKKYLDRYRMEYALKHKLAGDKKMADFYFQAIDKQHVHLKTKILFMLPKVVLLALYQLKKRLENKGLFFDTYH